jgi:hypothetical protein
MYKSTRIISSLETKFTKITINLLEILMLQNFKALDPMTG